MIKRMIIMLVLTGLVLGGVFGFKAFGYKMMMKYMAAGSNPPQTVSTIKVTTQDWQPELKAIGTLRAVKGADLAAEVPGIVNSIHFESGDDVEEGKTLIELRNNDDVAHLRALEAAARLAEVTLERDKKQIKAQAISQATVDTDAANLDGARALVAQQQATLDKKIIKAPFGGRIGIRAVDVGQYLNAGTAVVTIQQLDPIYFDFYLPQQNLPQLQTGLKVTARTDARPGKVFEGEITAINAKVDPATRNIQVRATFKNAEHLLLPGMYAEASVASGQPERLLTAPQTSITYNPYGNTVYVVTDKGANEKGEPQLVVKQTFVKTGDTNGDLIAILSGVKEGDEIVSAGQLKLRNGTPVIVNNSVTPTTDANPNPVDY